MTDKHIERHTNMTSYLYIYHYSSLNFTKINMYNKVKSKQCNGSPEMLIYEKKVIMYNDMRELFEHK